VALAFDKSALFAFDKAAGEPCRHLDGQGGCAIHAARAARGFRGCMAYDCLGAGQRVTQAMFRGRSWRDDPALLAPMVRAFLAVERAHRLLQLLSEAARLPLTPADERRRGELEVAVQLAGAEPEAVARLELDTRRFLRGLRACLGG